MISGVLLRHIHLLYERLVVIVTFEILQRRFDFEACEMDAESVGN
jgi:hypothetical protein